MGSACTTGGPKSGLVPDTTLCSQEAVDVNHTITQSQTEMPNNDPEMVNAKTTPVPPGPHSPRRKVSAALGFKSIASRGEVIVAESNSDEVGDGFAAFCAATAEYQKCMEERRAAPLVSSPATGSSSQAAKQRWSVQLSAIPQNQDGARSPRRRFTMFTPDATAQELGHNGSHRTSTSTTATASSLVSSGSLRISSTAASFAQVPTNRLPGLPSRSFDEDDAASTRLRNVSCVPSEPELESLAS